MRPILLTIMLALLMICQTQAQQLKLAQGELLTHNGKPIANQTLLIEGKASTWSGYFRIGSPKNNVKTMAITDESGFFQIVDLPAGEYTLKLVQAGKEPVPLKTFKLERGYQNADLTTKLKISESLKLQESLDFDVLRWEERSTKIAPLK